MARQGKTVKIEHPGGRPDHVSARFRDVNEAIRHDDLAVCAAPAKQRLAADALMRAQVDDWLVDDEGLVPAQRPSQSFRHQQMLLRTAWAGLPGNGRESSFVGNTHPCDVDSSDKQKCRILLTPRSSGCYCSRLFKKQHGPFCLDRRQQMNSSRRCTNQLSPRSKLRGDQINSSLQCCPGKRGKTDAKPHLCALLCPR